MEGLTACMPKLERGHDSTRVSTLPTLRLREPALRPFKSVPGMILGDPPTSAVKHKASSPGLIRLNSLSFPVFEPQDVLQHNSMCKYSIARMRQTK